MMGKKTKLLLAFIITLIVVIFLIIWNNTIEGEIVKFYSSGEKEIEYFGNEKNGLNLYYFKSGNLSKKIEQKYRVNDGKYLTYYESGELLDSAIYSRGIIKSSLFSFYKTGQVKSILNVNDKNKKHGMAYSFYKNGQLQAENFFIENHMYYAKSYSKKDSTIIKEKIVPKIIVNKPLFNLGDTVTIISQLFDDKSIPYSSSDLFLRYDFGLGKSSKKYRYPTILVEEKNDTSKYIVNDKGAIYLYGSVFKKSLHDTLFENASYFEYEINVK